MQPRIALSLETQPLRFQTLNLKSEGSTVNYDVRPVWLDLKQPSNKRPGKSDQKIRRSEEACKARTEVPLEPGAKISDMLEELKMSPLAKQQPFSWIQMTSKSQNLFDMDKATLLPLRGSLG